MTRRVWIAQMKCPGNHCILASATEATNRAQAEELIPHLQRTIAGAINEKVMSPWCGLCGAKAETWAVDLQRTTFATIDEAMPALAEQEAENILAAAIFGDIHRTQKPN